LSPTIAYWRSLLVAQKLCQGSIHPTLGKGNSANFAFHDFYEVRHNGVLGSRATCSSHGQCLGDPPRAAPPLCVSGTYPDTPLGHPQEHDGAASLDRRSAASADLPSQRLAPLTSGRTGWPSGTSGTPTWASSSAKSLSCGAPTGVSARRVPATAPRVPPSLRRPRASHTSTTTYAFRYSHLPRFWLRPALCGTTLGLTQAPRCAVHWKWKGVGTLLSTYRPLWTDNLLAKRRRTAVRRSRRISYGPTDAAAERGSSSP
jgi:hypothetical protein